MHILKTFPKKEKFSQKNKKFSQKTVSQKKEKFSQKKKNRPQIKKVIPKKIKNLPLGKTPFMLDKFIFFILLIMMNFECFFCMYFLYINICKRRHWVAGFSKQLFFECIQLIVRFCCIKVNLP
jgi:hypothetical protein